MTATPRASTQPTLTTSKRKALKERLRVIRNMMRGPAGNDPDLAKEKAEIEDQLDA